MNVFISYSNKDKHTADSICHALEGAGVRCWIAPRDVAPGCNYAREIINAIKECPVFLLVFSESSNRSKHVENEVDIAFNEDLMIIPLRISDAEMSPEMKYYLGKKHWIDWDNGQNMETLVSNVKKFCQPADERRRKESVQKFNELLVEMEELPEDNEIWAMKDKVDKFLNKRDLLRGFMGGDYSGDEETDKAEEVEDTKNPEDKIKWGHYDILVNKDGEILAMIDVDEGKTLPINPRVLCDNGNNPDLAIIIVKNDNRAYLLTNLEVEAQKAISVAKKLLVVEFDDKGDIARQYYAPIEIIDNVREWLKPK